jgi:hypothetical protein
MRPLMLALVGTVMVAPMPAQAYVALMAGQAAKPLQGQFNAVPVLHSNQPEEVLGPGILVSTTPGSAISTETGESLENATYTFNGEFGLHVHHKYHPQDRSRIVRPGGRRGELTLATILINPGATPVHLRFSEGAVRNSFEAPYLATNLMGVKPLGPRPWNTGPGDATAVQMLRQQLDRRLADEITIPPYSRMVLFSTALPAKGIANGLLKGRSDGPFQMAVVAAEDPTNDSDILAVLDSGRLAPGRIYLSRIHQIQTGAVFSRVAGVALGDRYDASVDHDLDSSPLHVPLTSTNRHHFGTGEVQVNALASRMVDSSLNNVGTYGVRFNVDLLLRGSGPYELVLSHPAPNGRHFTAFRGSIGIHSEDGYREVHVGMRSGQSLPISSLNLKPGVVNRVRVTLVYPADATPGHLLSVVPQQQLAQLRERERLLAAAQSRPANPKARPMVPNLTEPEPQVAASVMAPIERPRPQSPNRQLEPDVVMAPGWMALPPVVPTPASLPATVEPPMRMSQSLMERYEQAVQAQQRFIESLMGR